MSADVCIILPFRFQHTAARRRLDRSNVPMPKLYVSTHSRPKAAVVLLDRGTVVEGVSTHSRPKAAVDKSVYGLYKSAVSTHSRPKAAEAQACGGNVKRGVSTHSRPKAAEFINIFSTENVQFQHTAARRRLKSCKSWHF